MPGWFQAMMPREERFFELFVRHATIVVAGAEALRGLLKGGDGVERYCQQIFEREAEADEVTRQVLTAVRRTFVTPFDRTDIQNLATMMDDAIDQMNKDRQDHHAVRGAQLRTTDAADGRDHFAGGEIGAGGGAASQFDRQQRRSPQRTH
jgi:hypothetical protein